MTNNQPERNVAYSLAEVMDLNLPDSPNLYIGELGVIQDAHISSEDLLAVPHMDQTRWVYDQTTDDDVPLFHCVNPQVALLAVDIVPVTGEHPRGNWITPKGHPQEQDHEIMERIKAQEASQE